MHLGSSFSLFCVWVKRKGKKNILAFKKVFLFEQGNTNPDQMNVEIVWKIKSFKLFQLSLAIFMNYTHPVFRT